MAFEYTLPLRVAQGVLTIIIFGLTVYSVDAWAWDWSPDQINFLLFTSVWTVLALVYLLVAPGRFAVAAHKYGILAAEAITMIFWFAGWIAVAALLGDIGGCQRWGPCNAAIAATIFGAFEWLLFSATMIMAALHVHRTRNSGSTKHDPAMEVHPGT